MTLAMIIAGFLGVGICSSQRCADGGTPRIFGRRQFFWNSRSMNEDDILWTFQEMTDTEILRLTHGSGRVYLCLFQHS